MPIFSQYKQFQQAEDANLDYQCDWEYWLGAGDTITTSTWSLSSTDIVGAAESHTITAATIWLSGGVLGRTYEVTNHITTVGGDAQDQTFNLEIVKE